MKAGNGLVALVTGASSGIGKATAHAFAREGYTTILSDVSEEAGHAAAKECSQEGAPCYFIGCDVSDESSVRALIAEIVSTFGRLDAAFNNAGILGEPGPTAGCSVANFDRIIAVNLRGVFLCLREELNQMAKQEEGGAIVNCSSVAGLVGVAGIPVYVASKHGVAGLTKAAALENAKSNIRINAVSPGAIETPMLDAFMSASPNGREATIAIEPVGRLGHPKEIAEAVVWLCSPAASFVTGLVMPVDGGWTVA